MTGVKKGLVAPQNSFLETVIRRCLTSGTNFLLANAQLVDYPIVYCNTEFSKMVGYTRSDVMHKSCSCSFMFGEQTDKEDIQKIEAALDNYTTEQLEIKLVKKNKHPIWVLMHIAPIRNDKDVVVLFLCQFKDITVLKQPLDDDDTTKGLNRILQIARIAKNKQQLGVIVANGGLQQANGRIPGVATAPTFMDEVYPQYKLETPKTPPHIVLHYSTFKIAWDWIILSLTYYTAVLVPYNVAFSRKANENVGLVVVDSIVDVIFFIDIVLHFHTTFVGPGGEVISDARIIRHNYLKSWFIIDLFSCLPYDLFDLFEEFHQELTSLFGAFKVIRLLRLGRIARQLDNYMEYGAATLLLLLSAYILVAHWLACMWYTVGHYGVKAFLADPEPGSQSASWPWLIQLAYDFNQHFNYTQERPGERPKLLGGPSRPSSYITALYFTLTCMTTVGFGNVAANTDSEKIFAVCMLIISVLLYAAIFGKIPNTKRTNQRLPFSHMTTIIGQMTAATMRYQEMINNVKEFIKMYEVPTSLAERVMDYIVSTWAVTKGVDTSKVLSYCPRDMKADISVHLNRKVFNEHSCFRLASDGCLRSLAMHFHTNHCAPGDLLYHVGESVEGLWFVVSGSLEVIQDDEVVAILGPGDVMGDEFWREQSIGQAAANVRALTYADLHVIRRDKLLEVLNFYQAFANSFARNITLTYNLRHRTKFRRTADVKRDLEMEERRKNEQIVVGNNHPVRQLLSKIEEKFKKRVPPTDSTDSLSESEKMGRTTSLKRLPRLPMNGGLLLANRRNKKGSTANIGSLSGLFGNEPSSNKYPHHHSHSHHRHHHHHRRQRSLKDSSRSKSRHRSHRSNRDRSGDDKSPMRMRLDSNSHHARRSDYSGSPPARGSSAMATPIDLLISLRQELKSDTENLWNRLQLFDNHIEDMLYQLCQPTSENPTIQEPTPSPSPRSPKLPPFPMSRPKSAASSRRESYNGENSQSLGGLTTLDRSPPRLTKMQSVDVSRLTRPVSSKSIDLIPKHKQATTASPLAAHTVEVEQHSLKVPNSQQAQSSSASSSRKSSPQSVSIHISNE